MSERHFVRATPRHIEVLEQGAEDADPASGAQFVYLGRQPILDRDGALNAYELLFRSSAHNYAEVSDDAQATAQVVARPLGRVRRAAVLGPHRSLLHIHPPPPL